MAEFETGAELSLTVPNRELAGVRTQIEDELADISVGVEADMAGMGGGQAATDGGVTSQRQRATWEQQRTEALQDTVIYLESIEDEITSGDALGGGGGGGGSINTLVRGGSIATGAAAAALPVAGGIAGRIGRWGLRQGVGDENMAETDDVVSGTGVTTDQLDAMNTRIDQFNSGVADARETLSGLDAPDISFGLSGLTDPIQQADELLAGVDDRLGGLSAPDVDLGLDGAMDTVASLDERLSGLGDSLMGGGAEPQYVPSEGMVTPDAGGLGDLSIDLDDLGVNVNVSVEGAVDVAGDVEAAVRDAIGPDLERVEQDLRDRINNVESQVERGLRNGRGR